MRYQSPRVSCLFAAMPEDEARAREQMEFIGAMAWELATRARRMGFILTIEQVPLKPLAQGHHRDSVQVTYSNPHYRHVLAQAQSPKPKPSLADDSLEGRLNRICSGKVVDRETVFAFVNTWAINGLDAAQSWWANQYGQPLNLEDL